MADIVALDFNLVKKKMNSTINEIKTIPQTNFLVEGPIAVNIITQLREKNKYQCGAEALFLGTIRRDEVNKKWVRSIDYTAYTSMADKVFKSIENHILKTHKIQQLIIFHAVGEIKVGEISMLVFVQSKHRKAAFAALEDTVEYIKAYAPVWKKENYEDGTYDWVNCKHCHHAASHLKPLT